MAQNIKGQRTNTGRTHFKKGNLPPMHKEGCGCFRCSRIPWNKGLKYDEETKARLDTSGLLVNFKGNKLSEEVKKKISKSHIGIKHTRESRIKISAIQQGIKVKDWTGWSGRDRTKREKFYTTIRREVLERDDYTCQLCGEKAGILHVDHIQKWSEYVEGRFSMDNCRTVCRKCHYFITFNKSMPTNSKWGTYSLKGVFQN